MKCEFEEKQYEQLMNIELAKRGQVYPSGQCLENDIAIDAAVFSGDPALWEMWRTHRNLLVKPGVYLRKELWEFAERGLRSDLFPKFRCNLFIQYKRPESVLSPNGNEYPYWKEPYFRYRIDEHQQEILYRLELRVRSHAIVVYACPCFCERNSLWRFMNGSLTENSNFVKAHRLEGHQKYTFIHAGKDGYAFSEPSKTEGTEILKEIQRMIQESTKFEDNVQFLNGLARDIKMVVGDLGDKASGFFAIRDTMVSPDHELRNELATVWSQSAHSTCLLTLRGE